MEDKKSGCHFDPFGLSPSAFELSFGAGYSYDSWSHATSSSHRAPKAPKMDYSQLKVAINLQTQISKENYVINENLSTKRILPDLLSRHTDHTFIQHIPEISNAMKGLRSVLLKETMNCGFLLMLSLTKYSLTFVPHGAHQDFQEKMVDSMSTQLLMETECVKANGNAKKRFYQLLIDKPEVFKYLNIREVQMGVKVTAALAQETAMLINIFEKLRVKFEPASYRTRFCNIRDCAGKTCKYAHSPDQLCAGSRK